VRADAKAAAQEKPNEGDDMNTGTSGSLAERQAFEKWLGRESFTERSDSGKYVSAHVDAMWSAWSARAVLAAPQNTPAAASPLVPPDFVMVPREPTPEMIKAASETVAVIYIGGSDNIPMGIVATHSYRAMLAAAPLGVPQNEAGE
jgi:hypothetical protein